MILMAISCFQKKFSEGIAVFIDFEQTFDAKYATSLGVDLERLLLVSPTHGEQGIDLLNEALKFKVDIFIGVDSLAAIVSTSTMEVDAEKAQVGVQARMINRMVAVCNARMKRSLSDSSAPTTTVVLLNQEREKVGVMFGDPTTTPGGKGKNFFSSVRLRLFVADGKANRVYIGKERQGVKKQVLVGRIFSFSAVKNKVGGDPFADGEYTYYVRPHKGYPAFSINNADALMEYGRYYGQIKLAKEGKKVAFQYSDLSATDEDDFKQLLIDTPEASEALREDILAAMRNDSDDDGEEVTE
jgi:recombination protein RecA